MSQDEIELAFFEEHGHNPDAQELHDFVNQMVGPGKPASPEEVDKLLAESERAKTFERLADEDPDVRQLLAELQKHNPDRSRGELLKDMDIVGRMMANHPGLTREEALKMIEDLGF